MPDHLWDWRRVGGLIALASGLAAAALAVMVVPSWVLAFLTASRVSQLTIGLLVGLEFAYAVILVSSVIGAIIFGGIFWRARRGGKSQPRVARGLLFCGSCLIGLALAEAIAATWGAPARRCRRHRPKTPSCQAGSPSRTTAN